jgi:UDPglucose 6-dehydrogenase
MKVLKAVEEVNTEQKKLLFKKLNARYPEGLADLTIALWGLSFKPETDDMREATSLVTIDLLRASGCRIRVFDPVAMNECRRRYGDVLEYADDMYEAVAGADALLLHTEWKQFRMPDWKRIRSLMRIPLVIDGRNIYDPVEMAEYGFEYSGIGR